LTHPQITLTAFQPATSQVSSLFTKLAEFCGDGEINQHGKATNAEGISSTKMGVYQQTDLKSNKRNQPTK
jgi:hypothetical protein